MEFKFTTRSQEAVTAAAEKAVELGNPQISSMHLLWALAGPISLRAALLGLACLGLVVAGARLRWSAPMLVGGLVGALLVLRELEPYAADLPPWVLIGAAGALLTAVGVTWESRLRDLRHAAAYVGHLR